MTAAAIIAGSLVDAKNVNSHKCMRLIIDVPAENALKVIAAFGWPTMVNPVSVAVARLNPEAANRKEASAHPEPTISGQHNATPRPSAVPASSTGADDLEIPPFLERRRFDTLPYAQQAALRCNDPVYRAFLREMCPQQAAYALHAHTPDEAAVALRDLCEVDSRADIRPGTDAEKKWLELERWFSAWQTKERAMA